MKLTVSAGGVPPGSYVADFQGVEAKESQFGPGLLWTFNVVGGQHPGAKATGMTTNKPTPQNKCGKFLAGVTGKALAVNDTVDLAPFVGKRYMIVVEGTDKGGSKVTTVMSPPAGIATAPATPTPPPKP
jgi:hypothetical protein